MNKIRSSSLLMTTALALSLSGGAFAKSTSTPEGGLAFDTGISNRTYPHSDWALINGKIDTVNPDQPWASAIVVEGANTKGLDITCRCFGDLAVRKLLGANEDARKANPSSEDGKQG
ncbi:hypothetical protein [Roseibium sp.]|uniref:hypothetical protein n=1 Tax=Roseibium sp. TaxID=1936156 RepID=UPI003D14BD0A